MNPKQKIVELHARYGIDRRELGKIMIIASTTLMLVSIHAVLTLQEAEQELEDANNALTRANAILNDQNFQRSVEQLQSLPSSSFKNNLNTVINAFEDAKTSTGSLKTMEKGLERQRKTYQWLVLIGILGNVAGIAVVYV